MAPLGGKKSPPSGAPGLRAYWGQFVKKWPKNLNKLSSYQTKRPLLLVAQLILQNCPSFVPILNYFNTTNTTNLLRNLI